MVSTKVMDATVMMRVDDCNLFLVRFKDELGCQIPCSSARECVDMVYRRSLTIESERTQCDQAEVYLSTLSRDMNATLSNDFDRNEAQAAAFAAWLDKMSLQNEHMVAEVSAP
jgi:hypothetical protein